MHVGYIIAACAVVGLLAETQADARDIRLARDGKSEYTIVLSKDASPSEKHAARELQKFLLEISGAGNARRSTLPLGVRGSAFRMTKADGII